MLGEQISVAWVQSFRFVEVRFTLVPTDLVFALHKPATQGCGCLLR